MIAEVKYPDVEVSLSGENGNAGAIMGRVVDALRAHFREVDLPMEERKAEIVSFREECMSGDYNHLLQTCMKWVEVT